MCTECFPARMLRGIGFSTRLNVAFPCVLVQLVEVIRVGCLHVLQSGGVVNQFDGFLLERSSDPAHHLNSALPAQPLIYILSVSLPLPDSLGCTALCQIYPSPPALSYMYVRHPTNIGSLTLALRAPLLLTRAIARDSGIWDWTASTWNHIDCLPNLLLRNHVDNERDWGEP